MQQILGVFGYLEMDAGQGGDFGFYILLGVRLEFGNYPTIRASPNYKGFPEQSTPVFNFCLFINERQGIRLRYYKRSC